MHWQIYGVWISLLVSIVGLGFIVWTAEPQTASSSIRGLFFVTVFILVWSATTAVIFSIKNRLIKSSAPSEASYEPIFYDSFFKGLLAAAVLIVGLLIKKLV